MAVPPTAAGVQRSKGAGYGKEMTFLGLLLRLRSRGFGIYRGTAPGKRGGGLDG